MHLVKKVTWKGCHQITEACTRPSSMMAFSFAFVYSVHTRYIPTDLLKEMKIFFKLVGVLFIHGGCLLNAVGIFPSMQKLYGMGRYRWRNMYRFRYQYRGYE